MSAERGGLGLGQTLTHFTRFSRHADALDNLVSILRDGVIRGGMRMVRGGSPVVCLFDLPLGELAKLLTRANRRRYEPFGIAVDKRYAYSQGARPVIYMPYRKAERKLGPDELWRVVDTDRERTPPVDWSFEREWRVLGDLALSPQLCVALVETWHDVSEIYDRFSGRPPCAGVLPLSELFGPS